MEQVYRIEIPIQAVDETDTAALKRLETVLQKLFTSIKENKTAAESVFSVIERGADKAKSSTSQLEAAVEDATASYDDMGDAAQGAGVQQRQAADTAEAATEKLEDTVSEVSDTYENVAQAAAEAGRKSGSAFDKAETSADKFTRRMEKSERTLRSMFKDQFKLIIAAIDRASPVLKTIWDSAKGLTTRTWHVAVRMKDFITAPFRKIWDVINSPITMALSVAGIGLSATEVLSTFNEFETGMSAVRSLTGATDEDFLLLKQTAKDLGATTSFSASQASEGMQYLAMAGWDTSQIIAAMPGLLDLAAAGATDLGVAADIVSDVMTAMGMSADQASRAADVFARTATSSNTTIEGLGETLKYAAPIAHSFGMTLEEVAAIAGMMGDAGIKGSQAGTALRSALLRMADPAAEAAEWMKKLNLSFVGSDGSMKSMTAIMRDTNRAFGTLTEAERLAAAQAIFGTEAASAWLAVIEQGPDTYDAFTQSLYGAAGAADEMAKTRLDNLSGDMEELGGALETAKLELMEKINPYLRSSVQWLTSKIPAVQTLLENAIDSGIERAGALKAQFAEVFGSAEFQNADGFAGKFFVAWDKIIAEPFEEWWSGGGRQMMLDKLSDFGEGAGELINGFITGVFAAIKGEEIDFEGLNITGLAKAGAESAKAFMSSFIGGLDAGDLFGSAPGLLQAGLLGFGAVKVGGGITRTVRTVGALKTALFGAGDAAMAAAPAVATVGQAAVTSSAGIAKAGTVLAGLKTALAAVPVWGWIAAAAITAAAVGIKLYSDAQEEQRQALLHASDAGAEAIENYRESAQAYSEFANTLDTVKELRIKIESDESNPQTVEYVKGLVDGIDDKQSEIEVIMSSSSLTEEQIKSYTDELSGIYTRRAELDIILTGAAMTAEEVAAYKNELEGIQNRKAEIEAKIAEGGLTASEISTLQSEYNSISSREAEITLSLSGQGLSQEELGALCEEFDSLNSRDAEITALLSEAGLSEEEIGAIVGLLNQIGDKNALLNVSIAEGAMSTEEIEAYSQGLQSLYEQLLRGSDGVFTQEDIDAGRITEEDAENYRERLRIQAETDLYTAQAEANAGMSVVPEMIEARAEYEANANHYAAKSQQAVDDILFMQGLEDRRAFYLAQYQAGVIDEDQLDYQGVMIRKDWYDYFGDYQSPYGNMTGMAPDLIFGEWSWGRWKPGDTDFFRTAIQEADKDQTYADEQYAAHQADYNVQNAQLVQQYQNEKGLIEGWTFHGSELAGMSLEEVAASYATLDEAGRQMFDDAVTALNALNAQTNYITDGEKTQATDIIDLAAKAEVMQNIQTQIQNIAAEYQTLSGEEATAFNAENLTAVNEALAALGIEKIESLDQLNAALEVLSTLDLTSFSLETAQTAFVALGGDAEGCKTKVDALRASLELLDGSSTTSTHTHTNTTINKTITVTNGNVALNANGGIYDGAMLSWVAEDGPEAIIPLGAERRERGLELWLQAGQMLGVAEFANGGIVAPYASMLGNLPDDDFDGGSNPVPVLAGGDDYGGGGERTISVSVDASPSYHIEGGDSDDILDKLRSKQKELAELFGGAIAEQLEDIVANMV